MRLLAAKSPASQQAEADALLRRYLATGRSVAIRNKLIQQYEGLVLGCAKRAQKYFPKVAVEELTSAGFLGLMSAIERYDPAKSRARFTSYAIPVVQFFIRNEFSYGGQKVGRSERTALSYASSVTSRMAQVLCRRPQVDEIAREVSRKTNFSPARVIAAIRAVGTRSLDSNAGYRDRRGTWEDFDQDGGRDSALSLTTQLPGPYDEAIRHEEVREDAAIWERVEWLLRNLRRGNQRVDLDRNIAIFWARCREGRALEGVGREFGITRERVRQICNRFLRSLGVTKLPDLQGRDYHYGGGPVAKLRRTADRLRGEADEMDRIVMRLEELGHGD